DFEGRLFIRDNSNLSSHATHVSGTVGGGGNASGGTYRGMAPGVTIQSYGFQQPGGLQQGFLYTDPGDMEDDYDDAINNWGAAIANNSIGTNVAANNFPCSWHGEYGVTSTVIDSIARGAFGPTISIVFAAGNERGNGRCGTGYGTTAPPANAKNHITVGALHSNNDAVTNFTSWGPTTDGRLKPDVAAPGCQNGPDAAGPDWNGGNSTVSSSTSASDTSYGSACGTSMAAPTATGAIALILEDFRVQYSGEPDPLPSTYKAFLIHTAEDIENFGPDYKTGYGSIRVQPAIEHLRSGNFLEASVGQGETYNVLVNVDAGQEFKATLVWDDPAGTPNVYPSLVNDLDLVVTDPNGVRHYPWTLDPANPANPAVRTQVDRINNVEQVFVENPTPGVWSVQVLGFSVPQGPQAFSLSASPFLVNCSTVGLAKFNRQVFSCDAVVNVQVVDCDLNTDDDKIETVDVHVMSDSDPAGFMITLTETGELTADFRADLPLSTTPTPGALLVAHGDTITVTYIDADDGMGGTNIPRVGMAAIDCVAPVISDVLVADINPRDARITFTTNEPATARVVYGTVCGTFTGVANTPGTQTSHTANLLGLQTNTTYFFRVEATDSAGNEGFNDNSGVCHTFATPQIPDYFTELFTPTGNPNDLAFSTITLSPSASVDAYDACFEDSISALPVDPTGGTALSFVNASGTPNFLDGFALVNLPTGVEVSLYGVSYDRFWVGTNGYITFNSGNTTFTESLANHFNQPRISALFDDLDLRTTGEASYLVLSDRVVVSWVNVPEFAAAGTSNTFQVQMHFDGTIVITWLELSANDGLAGLSAGGGVPVDFFMSDLSSYSACGPRPPIAQNSFETIDLNTPTLITLQATDDGLPKDPGVLTYIVQSLPTTGSLSDPNAGPITAVPYTLAAFGDEVLYTPQFNYRGPASFGFRANDGGTPPDGGDSNIGTVLMEIGDRDLVYFWNMDTDPGWAMEGLWEFGVPQGLGTSGRFDPVSGFTGDNVYGYNLTVGNGHYPNSMTTTEWLTTTAIDCSELSGTMVKFRRWLGVEASQFDKARFQASNDGVNWVDVWVHDTPSQPTINEQSWSLQTYNISGVADGEATVYLRWGMGPTDSTVTYHGWNIDDVGIRAFAPLPPCPGDANGDGVVDFADLSLVLGSFGATGDSLPGDVNGDGVIDFADLSLVLGAFGTDCWVEHR
ncbi:MAG: hypothetical protein EA379_12555, partial [Phycisphaerales bacterium]